MEDSAYMGLIKDALFPKKRGIISRTNKYVQIKRPGNWDSESIKRLRLSLHLSQYRFAEVLSVQLPTVIAWENDNNHPAGPVLRLLDMLKTNPDFLLEYNIIKGSDSIN